MNKSNEFFLIVIKHLACRIRAIHIERGLSKPEIDKIFMQIYDRQTTNMCQDSKTPQKVTESVTLNSNDRLIEIISNLEQHLAFLEQRQKIQKSNNQQLLSITHSVDTDHQQVEEICKNREQQTSSTDDNSFSESMLNLSLRELMLRAKLLRSMLNRKHSERRASCFGIYVCGIDGQ